MINKTTNLIVPTVWNRNWKPEKSISNGIDMKSITVDQNSIIQFDSALNDLLDETKIELASRADNPIKTSRPSTATVRPISSRLEKEKSTGTPTPTPRRNSPFHFFTNSPGKIDSSSSSVDTGDGGFFTDVIPQKVSKSPVPSPTIVRTPSNERKQVLTNRSARSSAEQHRPGLPSLISLRKTSIESLSRAPPKRSLTLEEAHHHIDDQSRPGSSLSSASLPVSITSSKPDIITQPSIERHPNVTHQPSPLQQTTKKKFRVEFSKNSSPPAVPAMVIEGKKVTSARNLARIHDDYLQQSINSTRNKISSGVQRSQALVKTSSTSSMTSITRDDNILRDESLTVPADLPTNKSAHRRSSNIDREPIKSRRMEFSFGTGVQWQQTSSG